MHENVGIASACISALLLLLLFCTVKKKKKHKIYTALILQNIVRSSLYVFDDFFFLKDKNGHKRRSKLKNTSGDRRRLNGGDGKNGDTGQEQGGNVGSRHPGGAGLQKRNQRYLSSGD